MGFTLAWKSNYIGVDNEEVVVKANYLTQEDAERQADAYAEVPGAPAPQYILDDADDPVPLVIWRDVEVFTKITPVLNEATGEVVGCTEEVIEDPSPTDAGVVAVTQERIEDGDEFEAAKAQIISDLETPAEEPAEG